MIHLWRRVPTFTRRAEPPFCSNKNSHRAQGRLGARALFDDQELGPVIGWIVRVSLAFNLGPPPEPRVSFSPGGLPLDDVPHLVPRRDMPRVNIRPLRDTRKLKAWLHAGKTVELRKRDKVIARIVPNQHKAMGPCNTPTSPHARRPSSGIVFYTLWRI